jgi:para-nitrobenzyl esterase
MIARMIRSIPGLTFLALAALNPSPGLSQITTVTTAAGNLEGVLRDGVVSYKGVPFAAPPVGELRWKPPQPASGWSGTRKADRFAASCMQSSNFLALFGAPPETSEDCLYLNVWTPAKSSSDRLPVMVWIYGGGMGAGSTAVPTYDGQRLAQRGVVLVSIAYRTGAFGFLAHPDLSRENGKGSGTFGLRDQIAGLEWVKANIARFGGDPTRVTLFGQSAGAISVSMLAASPRAKGLFQRVISQSGGSFAPPRLGTESGQSVPHLSVAEDFGKTFLEKLGARDIASARALGAEVIQKAVGTSSRTGFWPASDGDVLPRDAQAKRAAADTLRDSAFGWPTWAWALLQSQRGKGKSYLYYFDHRTPQSPSGAVHGADNEYVFGTFGKGSGPGSLTGAARAEDLALSDLMTRYWVNFAKTGNPNGPGIPPWPAFSSAAQQAMILGSKPGAGPVPNLKQVRALDAYFAWRRQQLAGRTVAK